MDSAFSGLFRGWRLLWRAVDNLETRHAADAEADAVPALVTEARSLATDILDEGTEVGAAVHALHIGPVQRLGHPSELVVWCDLDHGQRQDPKTLRLVGAAGAAKEQAAREAARALLARDPDALAADLKAHLALDQALRAGPLRQAYQMVLALLVVGLPAAVAIESLRQGLLPSFSGIMVLAFVTGFLLRQLVRSLGEGSATGVHGHEGREIILLRPFDEDRVGGEEALVSALSRWGAVRAIGRPGQTLPPLGAHRVYLSAEGEGWKATAARLIQSADAIVLRVGPAVSEGFRWEIEYIVAHEHPTRVVVALPTKPEPYAAFREAAAGLFPRGLPAERPAGVMVLGFDDGWNPVPLPPDRWGRWKGLTDRYEDALRDYLAAAAPADRPPRQALPAGS